MVVNFYCCILGAFLRPEFAQYFASNPFARTSNPLLRNKIIFPPNLSQSVDVYMNGQEKLQQSAENDLSSQNSSD